MDFSLKLMFTLFLIWTVKTKNFWEVRKIFAVPINWWQQWDFLQRVD
jgi:hypothetical protein